MKKIVLVLISVIVSGCVVYDEPPCTYKPYMYNIHPVYTPHPHIYRNQYPSHYYRYNNPVPRTQCF